MELAVYDSWASLTALQHADVREILEQSFPPEERRAIGEIAENLDGPWLQLVTAEENGRIYGLITVWDLGTFTFLEHFAVRPGYRGRGLGSRILDLVAEYWPKGSVLEVEPPTGSMERRRIGFYARNGYVLNDYPYLMPDLSGGSQAVPLLLMSRPGALADPKGTICRIYDIPYGSKQRPTLADLQKNI